MPRGRVCGSLDCAHLMAVVAPQLCAFWQNRTSQAGAGVASPVLRAAHKHTRTTYNANQLTRKQAHEATRAPHLANPSTEVGSFHRKQTICFGCARVSSQLPRACEDDAARSHARARSFATGRGPRRAFGPPAYERKTHPHSNGSASAESRGWAWSRAAPAAAAAAGRLVIDKDHLAGPSLRPNGVRR
jgi:hypothetical protein